MADDGDINGTTTGISDVDTDLGISTTPIVTPTLPDTSATTSSPSTIDEQYRQAVKTAEDQYKQAYDDLTAANDRLANAPKTGTAQQRALSATEKARQRLQVAADALTSVYKAKAAAYSRGKYTTEEDKQLAKARGDYYEGRATQAKTAADVATETKDANIAEKKAKAAEADQNVALAQAKLNVFNATSPDEIAKSKIAVDQAAANLQATQNANKKAGYDLVTAEAQSQVAGRVAQAGATTAEAGATKAAAEAGIAPELAQATLQQANINVQKAQTELDEAQRQVRQAPTDEQAQRAIELNLASKQNALDQANQQLEQAKQLQAGVIKQQGATIAGTEATTAQTLAGIQKGQLGPLYGVQDQIAKYKDMIASGQMTPDQANGMLSDWVTKEATGAGSYQRATAQDAYTQAMRQQDISQASQRLQTGASVAQNVLSNVLSLAKGARPGQGQVFENAYNQTLGNLMGPQGTLNQFAPPVAPAPPSAVSQAPVVHINIGSGPPQSAGGQGGGAVPAAPPVAAPAPAPAIVAPPPPAPSLPLPGQFPDSATTTAGQLSSAPWQSSEPPPEDFGAGTEAGGEPEIDTDNIPAMARGGIVTKPTVALIGERGPEAVVPLHGSMPATPGHVMHLWRNELGSGAVRMPGVRQPGVRMPGVRMPGVRMPGVRI